MHLLALQQTKGLSIGPLNLAAGIGIQMVGNGENVPKYKIQYK